ncbi:MAG: hypothetical protein HQ517_02820 [SAR324 cluster bacterium]|nr:hypothetical protein [SAR324 cluster bacterium]
MDRTKRIEELLQNFSEEQILRAIVNSYKTIIEDKAPGKKNSATVQVVKEAKTLQKNRPVIKTGEPMVTSDHPPCSGCGGIFFLRTGTCHVCQTCGTSQGCS